PFITLIAEENGCWSDTTTKPLGANPDFILETENARGCDSMTVFFRGKLNVMDALLFEWNFGDESPLANKQEVEHFYSTTGFYDVGLVITNTLSNCKIGFEIDSMIKVFPTPVAEITADPSFCYPDSAQISYTHYIDSSICTWNFEGAHQSGEGNETVTMVLDEPFGIATLTVNEYGCISPPAEITLKRLPHFDFTTEYTKGCQPFSPEIFADPIDKYLDFKWLDNDSLDLAGGSHIFMLSDSGRADIGLIATSGETGCLDTLVKKDWIWVHPKPEAAFEVDYPVALLGQAEISYTNLTESADNFRWEFGDGEFSTEINPQYTFTALGEYNSMLFAESQYGCMDTAAFEIKILPFSTFTPNAFRPNSEIPENRTFMPLGVGADLSRFSLKIYDRWGQVVFETRTPEHPWDGNTKNGDPAPMGNYLWLSDYYDIQGFKHNQKGNVVLIR
ncbi:MAG TPA: PKD domain-containing protein, partial [Prolixibacteraceae bacterium]|nr:PKD domain-containing protein [Prolixibacteraceae bacterium]